MGKLQEVVRCVKNAGAFVNSSCGMHVHVDASNHTPRSLKNALTIMYCKEDILFKALNVQTRREDEYCQKVRPMVLEKIRRMPNSTITMEKFKRAWYEGNDGSSEHYNWTRYYALNLHAVFSKGTLEWRCFESTLHALKDKIEVGMLSPLMAEFIPDYSDIVDLDDAEPLEGPDLVQYQTSIAEKVDEINRLGMPDNQPCNLIDYFDQNKDIKEKVERITMAVKEQEGVLYGCANLTLRENLTPEEYRVVGQYLRGQYSDGWGESLEQREIKVDGGELYLHFYVGAGSDFQIQVKAPENGVQEKQPEQKPSRPELKLLGHDGNIFSILGDAARLLRRAGMSEQANEMADRVHKSSNYYEALGIISEYMETELSDHREQPRTPRKETLKKEDTCR